MYKNNFITNVSNDKGSNDIYLIILPFNLSKLILKISLLILNIIIIKYPF